MKKTDKDKNPEEQGQEQKIQNPQDYFLISLSLFLSLLELLSFSHALSSFPLTLKASPLFQYWPLGLRSAWHRSTWRLWVGGIQIVVVRCLLMGSHGSPWVRWSWLVVGCHGWGGRGSPWVVLARYGSVGFDGVDLVVGFGFGVCWRCDEEHEEQHQFL